MRTPISNDLFSAFLECSHKAYRKLSGQAEQQSDFQEFQFDLFEDYRRQAERHLLRSQHNDPVTHNPPSLSEAIGHGPAAIIGGSATVNGISCHFDALLRPPPCSPSSKAEYVPVLFLSAEKVRKHDKLLLAFCGLALEHLQGNQVPFGKIVHGPKYAITKVHLARLLPAAKQTLKAIMDLQSNSNRSPCGSATTVRFANSTNTATQPQ